MDLLDPVYRGPHQFARTFEGFLFAAEDAHGPFVEVQQASRGLAEFGEWAANTCDEPYDPSAPNNCPGGSASP
jgi:hypothetical protein